MKPASVSKLVVVAAAVVGYVGTADAAIPTLNATCGNGVEVHADQGGPVYIDGNEAKLTVFNENYYEAAYGDVTISLSINPDGSPLVSATWKGGGNGMCQVAG
jgi:hypothetical protein